MYNSIDLEILAYNYHTSYYLNIINILKIKL